MKKENRLTRSTDIKRVKEFGKRAYHPLVVLIYAPNEVSISRAAVVASKKVGNAVTRNRAKRRLRAALDRFWQQVQGNNDLIFFCRRGIVEVNFDEVINAIKHLLNEAGVLLGD